MRLGEHLLLNLAVIICGDKDQKIGKNFPYRSSSRLTSFFSICELHHVHDGTTRKYWVLGVLRELNQEMPSLPDLPSDSLVRVITEVLDLDYFDGEDLDRTAALADMNKVLSRHCLVAFFD